MRRRILIGALCLLAAALAAQQNQGSYSRSITKVGGAFTVGDTFAMDNLGGGLASMTFSFIDPDAIGGFYYGLGGRDIFHTVGGVTIGDIRPVTIGWRKEAAGPLGFDLSLSPVLGSRIVGNTIFGKFFIGLKPMVGAFFAYNENFDIELAYEPVINLYTFAGEEVRNKTYHDLSLYVVLKKFSLIQRLGWNSRRAPRAAGE